MRARTRKMWTVAAMVAALGTGVSTARAQHAVLSSPPDSAELRELRVAVAAGPTTSTVWFSARLEGAADDVFVVVPAPPGAAVDLSTDAWFESLEDATNTRVLPPTEPPDSSCPAAQLPATGDHDRVGDAPHVISVEPMLPADVLSLSELVLWAQGKGLNLSFDAMSTFADLDVSGYSFVLLRYEVPPGAVTLATVRVASTRASASVPLLVTSAGASPADVHVWTFASGRASPGQLPWATVDPADVQWQLAGSLPSTNYRDVLASMWKASGSASWIVDAASHTSIFRSLALTGGAFPIPSLAEAYLERASGYGDAQSDPSACIARIASLESNQATVAKVCAPGTVASLAGDPCEELPQPGQIDPDDLRCGGIADDLAFALSEAPPDQRWLSRWTGRLPPWTARAQETLDLLAGGAQSPVVVCGGWDGSVCETDAGTGGAGGSGGSGGSGGNVPPNTGGVGYGGGTSPYDPPPDDPYYDDDYDDGHTEVYLEGSCWGDTSGTTTADDTTEDDSCSGDSSSSSSDEEQSCTGDSSSSASEDDSCAGDSSDSSDGSESCSGDTSDSSDGGDACSGDTSDSSSGADTCSGDSSSGSSSAGDSCSGSSSGGSSSDCSVSGKRRRGRGRLPTSAFALLIAASALAARRLRKADETRVPFR